MNSVTTRVPATTANLGPGFDCLGVALNIANSVTVRRSAAATHPLIVGDAAALFFETAGVAPFDFDWKIAGDVPQSRGLGSSVTVRLGPTGTIQGTFVTRNLVTPVQFANVAVGPYRVEAAKPGSGM